MCKAKTVLNELDDSLKYINVLIKSAESGIAQSSKVDSDDNEVSEDIVYEGTITKKIQTSNIWETLSAKNTPTCDLNKLINNFDNDEAV